MNQRNKLCPCGSGIKYKRCHGKNVLKGSSPGAVFKPIPAQITTEDKHRVAQYMPAVITSLVMDSVPHGKDRLERITLRRSKTNDKTNPT